MTASRWIWIELRGERILAYRYVDPTAGPSAKGAVVSASPTPEELDVAVQRPNRTLRQPDAFGARALDAAEARALGLPDRPPWVGIFEGESPAGTNAPPWRSDAALAGRFHPDYPDDLEVIVHDGEPRRTQRAPELCWVTVTGVHASARMPAVSADATPPFTAADAKWSERTVYRGKLLNQPHALTSARQGDAVLFLVVPGLPNPLQVTEAYLAERARWAVVPCDGCGADQGFDPPSVMARTRFPQLDEGTAPVMFTARCGCGGVMSLAALEDEAPKPPKPWWKVW
ncbi:MAG: hypothetical protein U0324_16395 [Polyangiales bacterium]